MRDIQEIQRQLQNAEAEISVVKRAMSVIPSPSLTSSIGSLEKQRKELEAEFLAAAKMAGMKVCSYRMFRDHEQPKLAGLAAALGNFQSVFSVVFAAKKFGPKHTMHLAAEVEQTSAFNFAYAFAGSVGIVLTVQDEQFLFNQSEFSDTIKVIAEVAKATSPEAIQSYAKDLGPAPIRMIYKWAKAHAESAFGADIDWFSGDSVEQHVLIQLPEFRRLEETIAAVSEKQIQTVVLEGTLHGADAKTRKFHMEFPANGGEIRGDFEDAISEQKKVRVPGQIRATLIKTTVTQYSTESDTVSWFLKNVEEI
jgi:hypothetical protein